MYLPPMCLTWLSTSQLSTSRPLLNPPSFFKREDFFFSSPPKKGEDRSGGFPPREDRSGGFPPNRGGGFPPKEGEDIGGGSPFILPIQRKKKA